ncbi:hypothetical protein K7432_005796 [Basidiobolus ranarum]|uniref:Odorant receptor n=1 Tax=Basidiobolus ranarum TaxID=34480 RepID=A0ABR2WVX8_9FUNG
MDQEESTAMKKAFLGLGVYFLGNLVFRRIQNIPGNITRPGLISEYFFAILFPMDSIRNFITQFVEITLAKDHSHLESALRSAYAGNGYWVNATPKNRAFQVIVKDSLVGHGSWLANMIMHPLHKHTIRVPTECESLIKMSKDDVSLILKHRTSTTQGRITKDNTIVTKLCFLISTLSWTYTVSAYAYYIWTVQHIPLEYEPNLLFITSIIIPFLWTGGRCIAPVFVSLESDELYLKKDFIQLTDSNKACEDVIGEKISDTKESIQREVYKQYTFERTVGSLTYLFLYLFITYASQKIRSYGIEGTYPNPEPERSEMAFMTLFFKLFYYGKYMEATVHSAKCLTELGQAYLANQRIKVMLTYCELVLSPIYVFTRFFAIL